VLPSLYVPLDRRMFMLLNFTRFLNFVARRGAAPRSIA
jgi:hypothetical protein